MATNKTKIKNRKFVEDYKKDKTCNRCSEERSWVLDFHHINPKNKIDGISAMCSSYGIKKIKEEIDKCELLCANCHRDLHYQEQILEINSVVE